MGWGRGQAIIEGNRIILNEALRPCSGQIPWSEESVDLFHEILRFTQNDIISMP